MFWCFFLWFSGLVLARAEVHSVEGAGEVAGLSVLVLEAEALLLVVEVGLAVDLELLVLIYEYAWRRGGRQRNGSGGGRVALAILLGRAGGGGLSLGLLAHLEASGAAALLLLRVCRLRGGRSGRSGRSVRAVVRDPGGGPGLVRLWVRLLNGLSEDHLEVTLLLWLGALPGGEGLCGALLCDEGGPGLLGGALRPWGLLWRRGRVRGRGLDGLLALLLDLHLLGLLWRLGGGRGRHREGGHGRGERLCTVGALEAHEDALEVLGGRHFRFGGFRV